MIAKRSPFTKDLYKFVARRVAEEVYEGRVLDVGTSPGYLPLEIAELVKGRGVRIFGIDLGVDMIRIAKKNADRVGFSGVISLEVMNAAEMRYEDNFFGMVVSTGSFYHWRDRLKVLKEIWRVTKPRGKALIFELRKNAPEEDGRKLRARYGSLIGPLIYRAVAVHSAMDLDKYRSIIEDPASPFETAEVRLPEPFTMEAILTK